MKFFLVDFRRLHTNIDIPIADIYIKLKTDEITAEELPTDVRKVSSSVQLFWLQSTKVLRQKEQP